MGIFDSVLSNRETLFRNEVALDYDFMPKVIKYREGEQQQIAVCIRPLFEKRNGRNCIIYGAPGIGKTIATKKVLEEIEEKTDDITPLYINCWQYNTTYKIITELCEQLNFTRTLNRNSHELMKILVDLLNKTNAVLVFDEIDKAEDQDFLYTLLNQVYRKSIILITNYMKDIMNMDSRIKSRLTPETIEFRSYTDAEMEGILEERRDYAFVPKVWNSEAFDKLVSKAISLQDVRKGLYLLKEAGNVAELNSAKEITVEFADKAIEKMEQFSSKNMDLVTDEEKALLDIIKSNADTKMGDLYSKFQEAGGSGSYKTFQRKIDKLEKSKFISAKRVTGAEGNTKIVSYIKDKKLTEY